MPRLSRTASQTFKDRIKSFFALYFLQGLPYGLQTRFLPILFRLHGMSLANVGFYKLLLIPWAFKAFWAPFVDTYGEKRQWLSGSLILLVILCILTANFPPSYIIPLSILLFLFNLTTSVQDIALDALVIDVLTPSQLASGNVAQVVGYKTGTLFSGGVFTWLTGVVSWSFVFYMLAAMYAIGVIVSEFKLPTGTSGSSSNSIVSDPVSFNSQPSVSASEDLDPSQPVEQSPSVRHRGFCYFEMFEIEGTTWMLFFVILYKIGEQGVMNMFPLFLVDEGISPTIIGFWTGMVGQFLSLLGSTLGGLFIVRSFVQSIKLQMIVRAVSVLITWIAVIFWNKSSYLIIGSSMLAHVVIFLVSGSLTTCTFTLVMHLSRRAPHRCRATHYTVIATGEVLGKLLFSSAVGAIADYTSYSFVFGLFTLLSFLTLPMMFVAPAALGV